MEMEMKDIHSIVLPPPHRRWPMNPGGAFPHAGRSYADTTLTHCAGTFTNDVQYKGHSQPLIVHAEVVFASSFRAI